MVDGDISLRDSSAIFRYLARKFNTEDHWYPKVIVLDVCML